MLLEPCPTVPMQVYGPEPYGLDGRHGARYWIEQNRSFVGDSLVDQRLSHFPVAVFQPDRRGADTPVVVLLQGIGAPMEWSAAAVSQLLDRGAAAVLLDLPMAGERTLLRDHRGDICSELGEVATRGHQLAATWLQTMFMTAAADTETALRIAAERHGLTSGRVALFGVSLGALVHAYTFCKHGIGDRLLGVVGHLDLVRMARGFSLAWVLRKAGGLGLHQITRRLGFRQATGALMLLDLLDEIVRDPARVRPINPVTYADRVGPDRPVRLLVGENDLIARPNDAIESVSRIPDGKCYVVANLKHDGFMDHMHYFLATQMGDWGC